MNKIRNHDRLKRLAWTMIVLGMVAISSNASIALAAEEGRSLERVEQRAFQQAADAVADAVVQLRHLGGEGKLATGAPVTGVVIAPDGWIVTSLNGLEGAPVKTVVTFADGSRSSARWVARDFSRQLALLHCKNAPTNFPALLSAPTPLPGQWAIAIGRTYRADKVNLAVGVVSATRRLGGRAVQTDAAVSPANYGGPLVNLSGQVIGIIVPMAPQGQQGTEWYDSGIGFAVPFDQIRNRLKKMQAGHDIKPGVLGLTLAPGDPLRTPPVVGEVLPNGPAVKAGLTAGDRILAIDGQRITTSAELTRLVSGRDAGERVRLQLRNEGKDRAVELVLTSP